jgi:HAD superfamily phosphoserine phosphatase-like hydrolase
MFVFLKFVHKSNFYLILIKCIPFFFFYKIGLISKHNFKNKFLISFLSIIPSEELEKRAYIFSKLYYSQLKRSALEHIKHLKKDKNNQLCVVTASLDIWIKPICKLLDVNYICTTSNFKKNSFAGIKGPNCWGKQKVARIKKKYNLKDYDIVFAYGDSKGDYEMLKLADIQKFKFFL